MTYMICIVEVSPANILNVCRRIPIVFNKYYSKKVLTKKILDKQSNLVVYSFAKKYFQRSLADFQTKT